MSEDSKQYQKTSTPLSKEHLDKIYQTYKVAGKGMKALYRKLDHSSAEAEFLRHHPLAHVLHGHYEKYEHHQKMYDDKSVPDKEANAHGNEADKYFDKASKVGERLHADWNAKGGALKLAKMRSSSQLAASRRNLEKARHHVHDFHSAKTGR